VLLGNIHPALQLEVLEQVTRPRLVIADTMNFWIEGEPALVDKMLKRIDTLVINDEEARQLSGHHNIRRAARAILQRGPRRLIIKRGEHGALLFDDHGVFAARASPSKTWSIRRARATRSPAASSATSPARPSSRRSRSAAR